MLEDHSLCFPFPQVHKSLTIPLIGNSSSTPYSLHIKVNYKDLTAKATFLIALLLLRDHYTTTTLPPLLLYTHYYITTIYLKSLTHKTSQTKRRL
jgi:hypothetical protein